MPGELYRKVKAARSKLGLSQSQAAREWAVSVRTIQEWEQGRMAPRGLALKAIDQMLDSILADPPKRKTPARKAAKRRKD